MFAVFGCASPDPHDVVASFFVAPALPPVVVVFVRWFPVFSELRLTSIINRHGFLGWGNGPKKYG